MVKALSLFFNVASKRQILTYTRPSGFRTSQPVPAAPVEPEIRLASVWQAVWLHEQQLMGSSCKRVSMTCFRIVPFSVGPPISRWQAKDPRSNGIESNVDRVGTETTLAIASISVYE